MNKREMKREVRAVFDGLNIDELAALEETTTPDYCRRRLSECMITKEPLTKALPFLILGIIQGGSDAERNDG